MKILSLKEFATDYSGLLLSRTNISLDQWTETRMTVLYRQSRMRTLDDQ